MIRIFRIAVAAAAVLALAGIAPAQEVEEGIRLYLEGQYDRAHDILAPVVEAQPANTRAKGYLGLTLLELGQYDRAERYLNETLESGGEQDSRDLFLVGLGRVYLERQNADAAIAALDRAEAANSRNADIYYYRGLAHMGRRDFGASVRDLEQSLALEPGRAMAHYYAGLAYNGLGQRGRMVEHFQTFLRLAPDAPEAERVRSLLRTVR